MGNKTGWLRPPTVESGQRLFLWTFGNRDLRKVSHSCCLLGLWPTDILCLPNQVAFWAPREEYTTHVLRDPLALCCFSQHRQVMDPSIGVLTTPLLSRAVAGASVGLVLPQGQEWGTWHPRDRHFPVTVCPMGFSCSPGWVLGPSELEAGFKPHFLHSSSRLPRWLASSSFYLHPHLRKTRSRHVCTLGPGLPLSVPAAS